MDLPGGGEDSFRGHCRMVNVCKALYVDSAPQRVGCLVEWMKTK